MGSSSSSGTLYVLSIIIIVYWGVLTLGVGFAYYSERTKLILIGGGAYTMALLGATIATFVDEKLVGAWGAMAILCLGTTLFCIARFFLYKDAEGRKQCAPFGLFAMGSFAALIVCIIGVIIAG